MFRSILSVFALLAVIATPLTVFAQTTAPVGIASPQTMPAHRVSFAKMLTELNLTPAQTDQIKSMTRSTRAANKTADSKTRRANNKALRAQILGVLTPAQSAQLHSMMGSHSRTASRS